MLIIQLSSSHWLNPFINSTAIHSYRAAYISLAEDAMKPDANDDDDDEEDDSWMMYEDVGDDDVDVAEDVEAEDSAEELVDDDVEFIDEQQ